MHVGRKTINLNSYEISSIDPKIERQQLTLSQFITTES